MVEVHPQIQAQTAPKTDRLMKAVRFHGKEDLRLEEIAEPECDKGQIKIKPAWCGICGRVSEVSFVFQVALISR